jgi:hypothetical protein
MLMSEATEIPSECKSIVAKDPERVKAVFTDLPQITKIYKCMGSKKDHFESELISTGACSKKDLSKDPPCGDHKCIAGVKAAVSELVDDCIPEGDFPIVNPFFKCLTNHADDYCKKEAASIMALGEMALGEPFAFVQDAHAKALEAASQIQPVRQESPGFMILIMAASVGCITGASIMWVSRFAKGMSSARSTHTNAEPLLA